MRHRFGCAIVSVLLAFARPTVAQTSNAAADVAPRILHVEEAVYPPEALRRGESAVVNLLIDVDSSGHVTAVTVAHSSGNADFDDAAVTAARDFEFEPARRNGERVSARIRYRYRFTPPPVRATDEDAPAPLATTTPPPAPAASASPGPGSSAPPGTASSARPASSSAPAEQGVTVYSHAPSREIGRREVTAEEVRRIPGARGDALLAIQNLPGVARPQFGIGEFIVRSSPPEDTLVLLEGQPIALPFHFGGLASTIATDMIERIEFLPGNFSTRYGRAAGGVINVTLRAPPRDRVHATVDLDVIDAGAYASAPLGHNASVAIGARRSFIDIIGPAVFSGAGGTSFSEWPFFWDAQAMLDWDLSDKDSIRIVAAASDDQLILNFADPNANDPNVRGAIVTNLGYYGIQTRWRHRFSRDVIHTFAPAISYNLSEGALGSAVSFDFRSYTVSIRDELEVHISPSIRAFLGTDTQTGYLNNRVTAPPLPLNGIQDPINPNEVITYQAARPFFNPGFYAETEVDATRNVRLLAGVRIDEYSLLHNAVTIDPRSTVRIALMPRVVLRAGFGQFSTPPRGYYIVPGFGNPDLQPERWYHLTVGAELEIVPGTVFFDTDAFIKLGDHVITPTAALRTDDQGQQVAANFSNEGHGRVIGGEWMLRVRPGRLAPIYGLISYTYQRAERTVCAGCPFATYQYDQPHILSFVLGAILPYGIEAGLRVRYTSGLVDPNVTGAVYDADQDVSLSIANPLNPGRLPDYFTLDIRASKRFTLGPIHGQAIVEVLNTTNNANVESRIYSYDRRTSQYVTGLPIIPNLGVRAEY